MTNKIFYFLPAILFVFSSMDSEKKTYVVSSILGGFGNRMLESAATFALAWDNESEPYFPDCTPYLPYSQCSLNNLLFRFTLDHPKSEIACECITPVYKYELILFANRTKLSRYSQNDQYFPHHKNRLINLLSLKDSNLQYIKKKYGWILDPLNSVCIHIRDYLAEKPNGPSLRHYNKQFYKKSDNFFQMTSFLASSATISILQRRLFRHRTQISSLLKINLAIPIFISKPSASQILFRNSTFNWWTA